MAIIQSGDGSGNTQTVDGVSKAGRGTLYAADGTILLAGTDNYMQDFDCGVGTAVPAAGSSILHLWAGSAPTKTLYIRQLYVSMQTVTAATAAQKVDLRLVRTSGAAASGGTAIAAASIGKKRSTTANSIIADFRYAAAMAALTMTGITIGTPLAHWNHLSTGWQSSINIEFDQNIGPLVLLANEGIAIQVVTTIGAAMVWSVTGCVIWEER